MQRKKKKRGLFGNVNIWNGWYRKRWVVSEKTQLNFSSQLHHSNIVKLIGFCPGEEVGSLVFEFVLNGSIEDLIARADREMLTFARRLKIALVAARALEFLHTIGPTVAFLDFRTANILVDESFNAKVVDFGQVREGRNTYPPYESSSVISIQRHFQRQDFWGMGSDIRDYGLLLLELLSGRPPFDETTRRRVDQ